MSPELFDLNDAFVHRQDGLIASLTGGQTALHPNAIGQNAELRWREMLKSFLPSRYSIVEGFVVDSAGFRSEQIDCLIVDRQYSPLWWELGGYLYLPAESVYAAFEIKQELTKVDIEYAGAKVESVRNLMRTSVPIVHAGGQFDAREPPKIIGGILCSRSSWTPPFGLPFERSITGLTDFQWLDYGCTANDGSFVATKIGDSPSVEIATPDGGLMSFALSLMAGLQGMGTTVAIDYEAYRAHIADREG